MLVSLVGHGPWERAMSTTFKLTLLGLCGVGLCSLASAQEPVIFQPVYGWSYLDRASTPVEGWFRGRAMAMQAAGQADYYQSLAAINYQQAFEKSLENRKRATEVYFTRKEMAKNYEEKYSKKPPTEEDSKRFAKMLVPPRLTPEQFDPSSGKLQWPHVLRRSSYDPVREKIDRLMQSRTVDDSGDGSPSHTKIRQLVEVMKELLKENMSDVTPQQYANAKGFLVSLEYEARQEL
jgi:hypothetical protein